MLIDNATITEYCFCDNVAFCTWWLWFQLVLMVACWVLIIWSLVRGKDGSS